MCSHLKPTISYLTEQAELAMTRAKELMMLAPNRLPFDTTLKELVESLRRRRSYGYIIKAPDGAKIGVLYTTRWGTRYKNEVRLMDGNQLAVTPHKYDSTWAPSK